MYIHKVAQYIYRLLFSDEIYPLESALIQSVITVLPMCIYTYMRMIYLLFIIRRILPLRNYSSNGAIVPE
jgi:hypothetical protein